MKYLLGVALLAGIAGFGLVATADDNDKKEETTIQGEVVDMACWLSEGKDGPDHAKCAKACVAGGTAAGIVANDGKVYLVVVHGGKGKSPLDHVGEKVEVKGLVYERGGVSGIIASSTKKQEPPKEGSGGK